MIVAIINLIIWCIFSILSGYADSILYHLKIRIYTYDSSDKTGSIDPHIQANILRGLVSMGLSLVSIDLTNKPIWIIYTLLMINLSYTLLFSFWHNGFYFMGRNKLDPNLNYNFTSAFGKGSIAKMNFNFSQRLIMAILGLMLFGTLFWVP